MNLEGFLLFVSMKFFTSLYLANQRSSCVIYVNYYPLTLSHEPKRLFNCFKRHLASPHPINILRRYAPEVHTTTPGFVFHKGFQSFNNIHICAIRAIRVPLWLSLFYHFTPNCHYPYICNGSEFMADTALYINKVLWQAMFNNAI